MPRFFAPSENFCENIVKIVGDDAYHIARALRMAVGDEITVADMKGREHSCRLIKIRDNECECEILSTEEGKTESPVEITLYMGYPKGDKLETVIQKAVELGAIRIIPFESSRCIKKPKQEKAEKQGARLSRIAEEAAKQCGRSRLPEVMPPVSFAEAVRTASEADLPLFCYEGDGTEPLGRLLRARHIPDGADVALMIGSEGGFSQKEAAAAQADGFCMTGLGPRILRTETAAVAAVTMGMLHVEMNLVE